jgi:hypothetical protein
VRKEGHAAHGSEAGDGGCLGGKRMLAGRGKQCLCAREMEHRRPLLVRRPVADHPPCPCQVGDPKTHEPDGINASTGSLRVGGCLHAFHHEKMSLV